MRAGQALGFGLVQQGDAPGQSRRFAAVVALPETVDVLGGGLGGLAVRVQPGDPSPARPVRQGAAVDQMSQEEIRTDPPGRSSVKIQIETSHIRA